MYRRIFMPLVVLTIACVFCGVGLKGYEKKAQAAEATTKADMSKPGTMPSGMQGMMGKGQMMSMCPMHHMMMGSMMSKAIAPTENGGVIVLAGDKLIKYDKDLNLVKEVKIEMDMEGVQKKMSQMMEGCPMCKGMMQGRGMMKKGDGK